MTAATEIAAITADVVIVGSGIAGAMMACELAQKGLSVVILEAGPRINRDEIFANLRTTPLLTLSEMYPNSALAPRPNLSDPNDPFLAQDGPDVFTAEYLRVVGGTTWHWGGASMRMIPSDFALRTTHGVGKDWPLSYDDLEPWYQRAEEEIGVCGQDGHEWGAPRSQPFPMPAQALSYVDKVIMDKLAGQGHRLERRANARNTVQRDGRPECHGHGTCAPLCPIGAQYAAIVHVEKAEALGVRVVEEALVNRVIVGDDGNVSAVSFKRPDGSTGTAGARVFVLAANAIETPRLLLASRDEARPAGIANSSDQVGRNLMSHPSSTSGMTMPEPVYAGRGPFFGVGWPQFMDGPERAERGAFLVSLHNVNRVSEFALFLIDGKGLMGPELDSELRREMAHHLHLLVHTEQLPDPGNRITLSDTKLDSSGMPAIRVTYTLGDYANQAIEAGRREIDRIGKDLGARDVFHEKLFHPSHIMGTACMGNDPRTSVTDAQGRTHDHANLFLAGSALFATSGVATPSLTIAALALRSAEAIVDQMSG